MVDKPADSSAPAPAAEDKGKAKADAEEPAAATAAEPATAESSTPQNPVATSWTEQHAHEDEEEDEAYDDDSALGPTVGSSTDSLSASILEYREIHGRTFHAARGDALYWGPNDARQNESMDVSHHVYTLVFDDRLFFAPIKPESISKVLDIGTGTGIWAIDFADMYPNTDVTGTDISPIQPSWLPPNCKFVIEDATQPWTFAPSTFDLVHLRLLLGSIVDWDALVGEAVRAARPGAGWVESVESDVEFRSDDGSVRPGMALWDWGKLMRAGGKAIGRRMDVLEAGVVRGAFARAGLVDVRSERVKVPVTGWSEDERQRQIGSFHHIAIDQGLEGYAMFMLTYALGWSIEQARLYIGAARKELRRRTVHPYVEMEYIYGRRPEAT